jgi:hypothetical protein
MGAEAAGGSDNDYQWAAGASPPNRAGTNGNGRRRGGGGVGGGAESRRGEARVRVWGTVPRRSASAFATAPASLSSSLSSPWFRLGFALSTARSTVPCLFVCLIVPSRRCSSPSLLLAADLKFDTVIDTDMVEVPIVTTPRDTRRGYDREHRSPHHTT